MTEPHILVLSITTILFGLLIVPTALRLLSKERVVFHLLLYIILGLIANLSFLLAGLALTTLTEQAYLLTAHGTLLAFSLSFGALTLDFLKTEQRRILQYWGSALAILLVWLLFAFDWLGWGQVSFPATPITETPLTGLGPGPTLVAGLGWLVGLVTTLIAVAVDFKQPHPTQYLNRLRYWIIVTVLLAVSGLILFTSPNLIVWAGLPTLTASSLVACYIVLSYHTPDLRLLIGRAGRYTGVMTILFVVYAVSLFSMILVRNSPYGQNIRLWAIALALILANLSVPLWRFSYSFLTRLLFGKQQKDEKQVIRHYSRSISSALDMNRLGDTIINLMIETLGIDHGAVFVNQRGGTGIVLRPLSSIGMSDHELTLGHFNTDSPFIDHFRQGSKIITQYDIDVLPEFRSMAAEEKEWLAKLKVELFVAIIREREFIGFLAFGKQGERAAYYDEDQALMIALADQAALAMDSARLFEQLAVINQEVGALTNQLAGLDQGKADFLCIASHELRTPLTHIHGYSRMLLDLTEEELSDPSYVKTIIEGIAKGSERMKGVIDLMFDVTEVDVGEMSLFTGPVDLEEVIDMATRAYLAALDERRIAFGKKGFKDLPTVEADGTRLVQAFENLIGNALKYTPDGGVITIESQFIVREEAEIGPAVEIVVVDTGIGIDPEHHLTIFEKFFRVDDTDHHSTGKTKFKGAGPGLGLTLVKGIAEAHGGKVWVESLRHDEVNLPGSKFFFVIPLQRNQPTENQKQSQIETRHWRQRDMAPKE
ncbi:MAG: HAMP domain-containing histidine kinase [Anaerolineae bacterium]|nr:HAMP domain-containing histidine kinase [Anaerolineae bacterium]